MFYLMELETIVEHGLVSFDIPFDGDILKNLCLYVTELANGIKELILWFKTKR